MVTAATALLTESTGPRPVEFTLSIESVPGFGSEEMRLLIDPGIFSVEEVERFRRTFEPHRQVELAAIALAGLALHAAGAHEIKDLAIRGSAADYLVDLAQHRLEVAGRSHHGDLQSAWQQKQVRLETQDSSGYYVFVAEFERRTARLGFFGQI
jgi:hypothetical protein